MKITPTRAFSLIELLAIVAIIAVIAALVFPVLHKAKRASFEAKNIAQLKELGMAYITYAGEHNGQTPAGKRHDSGLRGPRFGDENAWGSPARQLFDQKNPRWASNAEGDNDYLSSPDTLYSPFHRPTAQRQRGTFVPGRYGYQFMYSPMEAPLMDGFYNDHVRHGPRMPICSDLFGPSYEAKEIDSEQCAVLYLDGGVVLFSQKELLPSRRGWEERLRYLQER